MKPNSQRGALSSVPVQSSMSPVSKVRGVSGNMDLPSTYGDNQGQHQYSISFGNLLDNSGQQPSTGGVVMWSLTLGGNTVIPDEKTSLKLIKFIH